MKRLIFTVTSGAAVAMVAMGQLSMEWTTQDGGGGTGAGSGYTIHGTIGQPDAVATMTGGVYSVTGGFWVVPVAAGIPDAPRLTIEAAGTGFATLSWSPPTPGFVLQQSLDLGVGWTNAPSGSANPVTVPTSLERTFYRLARP